MNVVLINPPYDGVDDDELEENLGLSYIAGFLLEHGIDTAINEMTGKATLKEKLETLQIADIYGISLYSTAINSAKIIINHIRETAPGSLIYLGGPHPSALPQASLKELKVDGVVIGEGEYAFYNIVKAANEGKPILGVLTDKSIPDLAKLPFPARSLVDRNRFTRRINGERCISMLTSRGCPNNCLHCNSIIMGGKSHGIRFRPIDDIIKEIRLVKKMGYKNIRFNDDNFLANPQIHDLLIAIEKENISFRAFGHVGKFLEETCALMKKAGCQMLSTGIESCNPQNLHFLRKQNTLKYLSNLAIAKAHGLSVRASFIVGLPYDTDESIERYFLEASHLPIDEYAVYALIPYPGTELYNNPQKHNYYITSYDFSAYKQMGKGGDSCYVLGYDDGTNAFAPDDVKRWHKRANELLGKSIKHMRDSPIK